MTNGWTQVQLGDHIEVMRGLSYTGAGLGSGLPLHNLNSIREGGGYNSDGIKHYSGEYKERHLVRPGDIVVANTEQAHTNTLIGYPAIVPARFGELGLFSHHLFRVRLKDCTLLTVEYLYYLLRSEPVRSRVAAYRNGTTVAMLPQEALADQTLRIPSLGEQDRIVAVLRSLDAKVELNGSMNGTLDHLAKALFARVSSERDTMADLADHIEVMRGLSYTGAGLGSGLPLHNLNSIREGGGYNSDGIKHYSGEYKERHLVRPGDIVVANTEQAHTNTLIGYPAIVPARFGEVGLFSQDLFRVRIKDGSPLTPAFLYLLLRSEPLRSVVAGYRNGTTVCHLPSEALARPTFPLPSPERIRELDAQVTPLLAKLEANEDESETLAALRDALLPRLISGELRVRPDGPTAAAAVVA